MSANVTVTAQAELSPEQIAEAFWNLSSYEQAEFFFQLNRISGGMLGMQACYIREACKEHEACGAIDGFQKLGAGAFKFGMLDEPVDKWGIPMPPLRFRMGSIA